MKIAIIDKAPSRNDYSKYFNFEFELFHMSSVPIQKLLKKDVDLDIDLDYYDLVILVGAEAAKNYGKITSVTNMAGHLVDGKFVAMPNPATLIFKPEGKQDFDRCVSKINDLASNTFKPPESLGDYKGIDNYEEAKAYLLEILVSDCTYVGMDTETTALYPRDGHVLGICLSYQPKRGRYILTDVIDDELTAMIQAIIDQKIIVFHNLKFDMKMLQYHFNFVFDHKRVHDTMLMHYVLDENNSHGLKQLALKYTDYGDYDAELSNFIVDYCKLHKMKREDFQWDLIPFNVISRYASIDPTVTLELFHKFHPLVYKKFQFVYEQLLLKGTLFLLDMEEVGIPIDVARIQAAGVYLDFEIMEARQKLYEYQEVKLLEEAQGEIFNPNSVQQLRKLLFDYIGLTPTGKLTATHAISTDAEVLEELSSEHPVPALLLKVRQLTKLKNTYVSKILPELDRDLRIRTNFNLIFTTSGRLSSSGKFNAQQLPRDNPIIKGCIKAPPGYKIVSQDLQTGEMYFAAVLSGDKNLQQVFSVKGQDFHSTIAKMVFDLPCAVEDVKRLYPDMRQSAKAISFGILYGSGAQKVSDTVSDATKQYYGVDRAREDINTYFKKFSKLKRWLTTRKEFIEANGFTYSFFGRKRRLLNVFSQDKGVAAGEVRSGINAEVQSLCSDINLLAAIDTHEELKTSNLDAHIFMLVHDSIVALVKEEQVEQFCEILARNTQKDRGCSIPGAPIGIDQEVGDDYSFGKFDKFYQLTDAGLSRIPTGEK